MKYVCLLFLVCLVRQRSAADVLDVNMDNLEDVLKQRKAVVLYITDEHCVKCRRIYHKFLVTSQTFANDEVIFAQVQDKNIANQYEVTSFPGIVFYEFGSNIPRAYRGDVTSGELSKLVVKALRGDFRSLELHHSVELTKTNYDSIMDVADQCKLVMLHETDDEDEVGEFEELAETFGNDDEIMFARINVDKQKKLKKQFNDVGLLPAYYFYSEGGKNKQKLEGGRFNVEKMVNRINKGCGTFRVKEGRLNPLAGLIPAINDILDAHGQYLYEIKNIKTLTKKINKVISKLSDDAEKEIAEFYIELLEKIEEEGSIEGLDEVRNRIYGAMDAAGPLKTDRLFIKKNVVEKIIDIIGKHLLNNLSGINMEFDNMNGRQQNTGVQKELKSHDEL